MCVEAILANVHFLFQMLKHSCLATHDQVSISEADDDSSTTPDEGPLGPKDDAEFRVLLGRATWRLLHTMAARYPDQPDDQRKQRTAQFIDLMGHLYPCPQCAAHMRQMFADNPPELASQEKFSKWMCKIHNIVNERLHKATFPCDDVDAHYDCGCEVGPAETDMNATVKPSNKPTRPVGSAVLSSFI